MTRKRKILGGLFLLLDVLWAAFIFGRSLQPASVSGQESGTLLALVQRLLPQMTDHALRKLAHFTEFSVLGVLLSVTVKLFGARLPVLPLALGLLTAVTDELLKRTAPGRSCQISDMLLDFTGVVAATAAVFAVTFLHRRKKKPGDNPPN